MSILIKGIDMPKEGLYELSFAQSGGVTICLIEKLDPNGGGTIIDHDGVVEIPTLPSAEPKTGHWIGHREHCENLGVIPSSLCAYEWCSNCDCGIDVREWHRNHYNYCPNCGVRMEREEDDF